MTLVSLNHFGKPLNHDTNWQPFLCNWMQALTWIITHLMWRKISYYCWLLYNSRKANKLRIICSVWQQLPTHESPFYTEIVQYPPWGRPFSAPPLFVFILNKKKVCDFRFETRWAMCDTAAWVCSVKFYILVEQHLLNHEITMIIHLLFICSE